MRVPWRDRHGRFLPLKAAVLAAIPIPGLITAFWWIAGDLGGRPVNEVIHATGLWTVRFILRKRWRLMQRAASVRAGLTTST